MKRRMVAAVMAVVETMADSINKSIEEYNLVNE